MGNTYDCDHRTTVEMKGAACASRWDGTFQWGSVRIWLTAAPWRIWQGSSRSMSLILEEEVVCLHCDGSLYRECRMTSNLGPILRSNDVNTRYSTAPQPFTVLETLQISSSWQKGMTSSWHKCFALCTKALRLSTFGWAICSHVWNNLEGSVQSSWRISF